MSSTKLVKVGTHLPVLRAICDIFKPTSAIELGTGLHSTPLLASRMKKLVCVENDPQWFAVVRDIYRKQSHVDVLLHYVGGQKHSTPLEKYDPERIALAIELYSQLQSIYPQTDLLFVDHYLALRALALCEMYKSFRFVVWHDEQSGAYGYEKFFEKDLGRYLRYYFCFWGAATGFLIDKRETFGEKDLFEKLSKYSQEYIDTCGADMSKHSTPRWEMRRVN